MNMNETIESIEKDFWEKPTQDVSGVVKSCYLLRTKKLKDLDENDLRIALGQNIGLNIVVPLSIDVLKDNPFTEALYYEGDLLNNLLKIDVGFWSNNIDLMQEVKNILIDAKNEIKSLETTDEIREEIKKSIVLFESLQLKQ